MDTTEKIALILDVLDRMKAEEVVTIDVTGRTVVTDMFVVATANSNTHAKAIANELSASLKGDGLRAQHWESDPAHVWTVFDFGDVILHVFQEPARSYYDIEGLWGAKREKKPDDKAALPPIRKPVKKSWRLRAHSPDA